jgi:hypothetical protein
VLHLPKLKTVYRFASLVAYGVSLLFLHLAEPIAAKTYNDLCSSQGIQFNDGEPIGHLVVGFIVLAVPLFLARSHALVSASLMIGAITALAASGLFVTARDVPYECFTQAGTYEDHTSGLDGFEMWLLFAALLSYLLLVIDLAIWCDRKFMARRAAPFS